jgi:hypothetical protein
MKRLTILCLAGLLVLPAAHARLGENWEQIIKRFGQPTGCGAMMLSTNDTCQFKANEFAILVAFSNRVSVSETYISTNGAMTEEAVMMLLNLQKGTSTWERVATDSFVQHGYRRTDGEALALHDTDSPTVALFRPSFWKNWCDRSDAKSRDRFKGF